MNKRAYALDALRGYAIITMVLSATVAWNSLPGWMYHAQTPPPDRAFDASLSGITWVDLVFPFFLFAMGAAFPFSIKKRFEKGDTKLRLVYEAIKRGVQLTFFAIFIQHFYPYVLSNPQDVRAWLLSILCFIILFPMFIRIPLKMPDWMRTVIKVTAYVIAIVLLLTTQYANERTFDVSFNNIIILLLANMAVFGSVIYIFTMQNLRARIGVLLILMALLLSGQVDNSWTQAIYTYTPLPWAFHFEYLQYLLIVIPGSIAGEYLMEWLKQHNDSSVESTNKWKAIVMILLTLAIIIVNLAGLYTHCTVLNLIINIPLLISGVFLLRKGTGFIKLWRELFTAGAFLVVLGLCFEPFQGGIKKDPATLSYLFLTSGLAFMALLLLNVICDYFRCVKSTRFLVMPGQNPMMAYVIAIVLLLTTQYANERTFDVSFNNIIILLLANMAVFGSVIYIFTMQNLRARIGVLLILMALLLSGQVDNSWTQAIYTYTPLPWAFHFEYLQYLLIVIPGSIAGEYLMEWLKQHNDSSVESTNKWKAIVMILLTLAIIIVNLAGLYTHCTVLNLIINIPLLISGVFLLRKGTGFIKLWRELFTAGAFLVVLGLCFEPFQGGIKKDPATLSYLFLTSGLAFMALLLLNVICDYFRCVKSTRFLVMPGQNPMMAYVVGDLLIMPVINLLGIASLLVYFNENAWMGFLRGVVLTALSVLVTMFFTRIKCFWRT